jgi:hypothetical protein
MAFTRLVQIQNGATRRVALVEEPQLRLLNSFDSVFALATAGLDRGESLLSLVASHRSEETVDYEAVYSGSSAWRLLSPIDHPRDPARCLVSGTGLTHLGSATNRAAMHGKSEAELTDSMRMFRSGMEGGRPAPGKIGSAPEWFYKGNATILRAPLDPLEVPAYASDGGEEAEIAGVYLIDSSGRPCRIGMAVANEFSDHKFEKINYLNLAGSKIRTCSIGPELVIDPDFKSVPGVVTIERGSEVVWSKEIATGEAEMCHSLANLEHHHFKFASHRQPGDLHVHFYGACALSFGDGIELIDGDMMAIRFTGFGRPLRNPLRVDTRDPHPVTIRSLA